MIWQYTPYTIPLLVVVKMEVEGFLDIDTAIPCGLIINEVVSNRLRHAFPGGREGEIVVRLCSSNGTIELIVSDNGMGMPDNMDLRTVTSLGLHLVIILVEDQLDGEIRLDRSERTTFCITFESWLFLNVLKVHSNPVMKSREHSLDCSANLRFKTSESEMDFCHELEVRGG